MLRTRPGPDGIVAIALAFALPMAPALAQALSGDEIATGSMTEVQAASAVREFAPDVVCPYHYRGSDLAEFERLGDNDAIEVRHGSWY